MVCCFGFVFDCLFIAVFVDCFGKDGTTDITFKCFVPNDGPSITVQITQQDTITMAKRKIVAAAPTSLENFNMQSFSLINNGKKPEHYQRIMAYPKVGWGFGLKLSGGAKGPKTIKVQNKAMKMTLTKDAMIHAIAKAKSSTTANNDLASAMLEVEKVGNTIYDNVHNAETVLDDWLATLSPEQITRAIEAINASNDETVRLTGIADGIFSKVLDPLNSIAEQATLAKEGFISVVTILYCSYCDF